MRLRRAAALLAAAAAPVCWLATASAPAQASVRDTAPATHAVTIGDSAEAWYAAAPVDICTTPVGCPPSQAPTSPYPADTLHVGVAGGQESARTYLAPDFAALPFDATLLGGEMTLPVATGTGDGTLTPESAKIRACLATKPVSDGVQGSMSAAPAADCDVTTTATYDGAHSTFTLDLQPFVDAWSRGAPRYGLVLVPDTKAAQPSDAWHVTFNGRKRSGAGHITSSLTVRFAAPPSDSPLAAVVPAAAPSMPAAPAAVLPAPGAGTEPAAPPVVAGTEPQPQTLPAQPVAFLRPFQYPLVFLLPLALLAGGVFFTRLFTRDATPVRGRA